MGRKLSQPSALGVTTAAPKLTHLTPQLLLHPPSFSVSLTSLNLLSTLCLATASTLISFSLPFTSSVFITFSHVYLLLPSPIYLIFFTFPSCLPASTLPHFFQYFSPFRHVFLPFPPFISPIFLTCSSCLPASTLPSFLPYFSPFFMSLYFHSISFLSYLSPFMSPCLSSLHFSHISYLLHVFILPCHLFSPIFLTFHVSLPLLPSFLPYCHLSCLLASTSFSFLTLYVTTKVMTD